MTSITRLRVLLACCILGALIAVPAASAVPELFSMLSRNGKATVTADPASIPRSTARRCVDLA